MLSTQVAREEQASAVPVNISAGRQEGNRKLTGAATFPWKSFIILKGANSN